MHRRRRMRKQQLYLHTHCSICGDMIDEPGEVPDIPQDPKESPRVYCSNECRIEDEARIAKDKRTQRILVVVFSFYVIVVVITMLWQFGYLFPVA